MKKERDKRGNAFDVWIAGEGRKKKIIGITFSLHKAFLK